MKQGTPNEFRAAAEQEFKIYGYAARYGVKADIGSFDEVLERGCFDRSLASDENDIKMLLNHDVNTVLGSRRNGTLKLAADDRGLRFECQLNRSSEQHRGVYASVSRGDIAECSFMFTTPRKDDQSFEVQRSGKPLRRVKSMRLYEVSAVAFPAYQGTSVQARTYFDVKARSALATALGRSTILDSKPAPLLVDLDEVRDMVHRWRAEEIGKVIAAESK